MKFAALILAALVAASASTADPRQIADAHALALIEMSLGVEHPAPDMSPVPGSIGPETIYNAYCCKVCSKGYACGDSCISRSKECHKGQGCACDG